LIDCLIDCLLTNSRLIIDQFKQNAKIQNQKNRNCAKACLPVAARIAAAMPLTELMMMYV
jgi:hypothetical protein